MMGKREWLPEDEYDFDPNDLAEVAIIAPEGPELPEGAIREPHLHLLKELLKAQVEEKLKTAELADSKRISDQVNIKLLDEMDFDELSTILHDLKFIFNFCPPIRKANDNNDVKITGVESGSIWIYLGLTTAALTLLGKLMHISFKFMHDIMFYRQQMERLKTQKNSNEMIEALKPIVALQANMFAKQFNAEEALGMDNEEEVKTAKAIELISKLVEHNIAFQPSVNTTKEVSDAFPKLEAFQDIVKFMGGPKSFPKLNPPNEDEAE